MNSNSPVRVWVRSLGNSCRVRLESVDDAHWLFTRLLEENAIPEQNQIEIQPTDTGLQFQIPNKDGRTLATLESTLGRIAGVKLMLSPEAEAEPV